jgi:hypothetical protein
LASLRASPGFLDPPPSLPTHRRQRAK